MAKLRYEDFIDLILNLDVLGNNIDKDFKKLIFDNKDNTNFGLIRDYFFDTELIKELKNKLLDEEVLEGEKFEKFMEQLIVMYPLSKKLLETIIYNNRDAKVEKKLLNKLMFKNNVFINAIDNYVESIDACFSETKEEIENLKDIIKNIEIENTKTENLKKELEDMKEKEKDLKLKIEEREKLEKQIKDLKNLNSGEYDKKNKVLQSEIQNLEKQIEKKKAEQEEKNKTIVNLKESLKALEKNKNNEEEDKLICQLIKLWGDND